MRLFYDDIGKGSVTFFNAVTAFETCKHTPNLFECKHWAEIGDTHYNPWSSSVSIILSLTRAISSLPCICPLRVILILNYYNQSASVSYLDSFSLVLRVFPHFEKARYRERRQAENKEDG